MYRIELIIRETMAKFTYLTYIGVQIHKQVHYGIFTNETIVVLIEKKLDSNSIWVILPGVGKLKNSCFFQRGIEYLNRI